MLLTSLFFLFSFLLGYTSYYFLTGKATVFFTIHSQKKKIPSTRSFTLFFGVLFLFSTLISILLVFYHPLKLSLIFLAFVVILVLCLVIILNLLLSKIK